MLSRLVRFTPLALLPFAAFAIACESDLDVGNAKGFINGDPGCIGQVCGDECNVCDPADSDCVETAVLKQCSSAGLCLAEVASCGGGGGGGSGDCEYNGVQYNEGDSFPSTDRCNTCSCSEGGVACTEMWCEDGYIPCEGKVCGDACTVCHPDDDACAETAVLKQCDASGACMAGEWACEPGGCDYGGQHYNEGDSFPSTDGCNQCGCSNGDVICTAMACAYDSCGGKSCGDECTICDPNDEGCSETAVLKVCDEFGACGASVPACD